MAKTYYSVLTQYGTQLITSAIAQKQPLQLLKMAIGDGNGQAITPEPSATRLARQVYSNNVSAISVDPRNNKQVIFELTIPETEGGFWIREIGLLDNQNRLVAYANCPESFKPTVSSGSGKVQVIRLILAVSSSDAFELSVDNTVIFAKTGQVSPKKIDATSQNTVDDNGHAHAIAQASTSEKGIVQLTNDTGLDSENLGLTAKAGKILAQGIAALRLALNNYIPNSKKSDATDSNSSDTVATSKAVKEVKEIAESKQSPATTLEGYGIANFKIEQSTGNANDYKTDGNYYFASGQNLPDSNAWHIEVVSGGQANAVRQIARKANDTKIKTRFFNGSSWSSWKDTGGDGIPIGAIVAFPKEVTNPQGFLLVEDLTFNPQTYPDLYRTLGNKNKVSNIKRSDVGMLAYFPTDNISDGWIDFDSIRTTVTQQNYPELYQHLVAKYGSINNVPLAEDRFIRSVGRGLTVGQIQDDELKSHTHRYPLSHPESSNGINQSNWTDSVIKTIDITLGKDPEPSDNRWARSTQAEAYEGGSETRPKSIVFKLCIKAKNSFDDVRFWIKAFGEVVNIGELDAGRLAVSIQEIRKENQVLQQTLEQKGEEIKGEVDSRVETRLKKLTTDLVKAKQPEVVWKGNAQQNDSTIITLSKSITDKTVILYLQNNANATNWWQQGELHSVSFYLDGWFALKEVTAKKYINTTAHINGWNTFKIEIVSQNQIRLIDIGGLYLKQISAI
ncbi:phage tail collar domain-containing protein [Canicola haemoglobinophilus]|uniref:Phage tail collar domain-containing protein n=1 Tax=Canicola haemoglobinophilus TaxID=733 RepID=A0AB38HAC1_9PAST|nr:phage tail protein [Canicola haemoglobinophilus]STO54374.1 phage tail collar domain-containing protein [Canicola haemoglobinophilus]STO68908.1 phage tail collar domain-containing protein [Canicola haemoglobinophilus]